MTVTYTLPYDNGGAAYVEHCGNSTVTSHHAATASIYEPHPKASSDSSFHAGGYSNFGSSSNGFVPSKHPISSRTTANGLTANHAIYPSLESLKQSGGMTSHGRVKQGLSDLGPRYPAESEQSRSKGLALSRLTPESPQFPDSGSSSWLSISEAWTSLLLPLPFVLASAAYPAPIPQHLPPLLGLIHGRTPRQRRVENFITACALTSGTLLLVGMLATWCLPSPAERRRDSDASTRHGRKSPALADLRGLSATDLAVKTLSVLLPFYAAMNIGGTRTGFTLLVAATAGITSSEGRVLDYFGAKAWKWLLSARRWTCVALSLTAILDISSHLTAAANVDRPALLVGYTALTLSLFAFPLPVGLPVACGFSTQFASGLKATPAAAVQLRPLSTVSKASSSWTTSPLLASPQDKLSTFIAGVMLAFFTIILSIATNTSPPVSYSSIAYSSLSMASAVGQLFVSRPAALKDSHKLGFIAACIVMAGLSGYSSPGTPVTAMLHGFPAGVCCVAVFFDTLPTGASFKNPRLLYIRDGYSALTSYLLRHTDRASILHGILAEEDSRKIFYFMCLNLSFMAIQGFYGFVTGSLGLLSDSIHMLFDCIALMLGLSAAVMSKWPADTNFPYGYGKIETLSGFANGILLILISVEIISEAAERIVERQPLQRIDELLVISILGFLVNIVGLLTVGHGHHHGHGHSHGEGHEQLHAIHTENHNHHPEAHANGGVHRDHSHSRTPAKDDPHAHSFFASSPSKDNGHSQEHRDRRNENMLGLYLHILGDTLGSFSVIVSTILTKYYPSPVYDPLASFMIALFIGATAVPLVWSSAQSLLLSLPAEDEYRATNALQELNGLRGVVGYTVPRFWLQDQAPPGGHAHSHTPAVEHIDPIEHSHAHDKEHVHTGDDKKILGVIHVIAARTASLEDVRQRIVQFLKGKNMDVVVQVEREGEGR